MDDPERTALLARIVGSEHMAGQALSEYGAAAAFLDEAIKDSPHLLRGLSSALHETALFGLDREGRYLFVAADPALAERYGMDDGRCIGRSLMDVFPQRVAEQHLANTRVIFDTGIAHRQEYELSTPSGSFWHEISLAPLRDEGGRTIAVVGVLFDITERRRVEARARESGRLYRSVVEQVLDAILLVGAGTVLFANPAAHRMFGHPESTGLVGRPALELVSPEDHDATTNCLSELLHRSDAGGRLLDQRFVTADGRLFIGEVNCRRVRYEGASVTLCVIRDVTQRREEEQERVLLEEQMRRAQQNQTLGVLAAGVAHDFNNLLMGVLGNAALVLRQLPPDSPLRNQVTAIEVAAQRAAELTRQLRAYSAGDSLLPGPVNLGELLGEMTSLLGACIPKLVTTRFEIDPLLPMLYADATQLRQVVMNLIVNAAEAIGDRPGLIVVRARRVEFGESFCAEGPADGLVRAGEYVSLEVIDDGCGMDSQTRSHIFEPFFSTKLAGRGLGLAAVVGIVRGHLGALRVETALGKGSTFQLLFPPSRQRFQAMSGVRPVAANAEGSGLILVVDDEDGVRSTVRLALEYTGFEVLAAGDGAQAVELFRAHASRISAVVLDLTMPKIGGSEALRLIRGIRPDVPVVLSSGFSEQESLDRLGGGRVEAFFQKPYLLDALAQKLVALTCEVSRRTG